LDHLQLISKCRLFADGSTRFWNRFSLEHLRTFWEWRYDHKGVSTSREVNSFSLHNSQWSHVWRYTKENSKKFIHCRIWNDLCKSCKECEKVFIDVFTDSFILNGVLRFKTTCLRCNHWELNSKINLLMLCCLPHHLRKISQSEKF
jgi:hypothetical protein